MPRFSMKGEGVSDGDSSGSEHRHKRRKPNQNHRIFQDDGPATTKAPSAAPNAFAAKMMAKMGYVEGQGLGAAGKGRLAPIDAQMRPQGVGLGTVKEKSKQAKEEEKREAAFQGRVLEDSSEEERRKKKERKKKVGFQTGVSIPKPPKQKYRTAAEIEAAAEGLHIPNVLKSLIDATGSEKRLLSSTSGLMRAQDSMVPAETESMKLSRKAQQESAAFADEWRALQEREDLYTSQHSELESSLRKLEEEERLIDSLVAVVENLENISIREDAGWELTMGQIESVAQKVQADDYLDFQKVAVAAIHPLFKLSMQDWDPLRDPQGVSPYLRRVHDILQTPMVSESKEIALQNGDAPKTSRNKSTNPYETMIYSLWLPVIRTAVTSWNAHQPEQFISIIEEWQSLLPQFIIANVVDQLIEQRLASAIMAWKPKRNKDHSDRPSSWLFPWLQYLDDYHTNTRSSNGLMADVKRKLKSALSTWDIGRGLFPDLQNWQSIFKFELPHMLTRYVLKSLAEYFTVQFDISPEDQDVYQKPFRKILEWVPFFSIETIAQLFHDVFFKKWHSVLYLWLTGKPKHTEIMEWYQWWKQVIDELLPTGFNDLPIIKASWEKGLTMINVALDAAEHDVDAATELHPIVFADDLNRSRSPSPKPKLHTPKHIQTPTTFKDVVEDWCTENGLLMFPMREADLSTGLPLFRITASASGKGGVVLYLKGDIAWVRGTGAEKVFTPMGLDDALAARAEGR